MTIVRIYLSLLLLLVSSYRQVSAQCPATIDANFADALRTLYPTQNFVDANNTLTSNVTSYTGTLDVSTWGNAGTYVGKPKLTTVDGIQCFSSLTQLNVRNQSLASLPALPASVKELRCNNNLLTALPTLPAGLIYLHCATNKLAALPDLPPGLQYLACGANQLTALPTLPAGLLYLRCNVNSIKAPSTSGVTEADKTLGSLPDLPAGLLALNVSDNKLTTLPTLPASLVYLNVVNNKTLTCLPTLPGTFFTPALPTNTYYTDMGALTEARLNVTGSGVNCLPNLPTGFSGTKIAPNTWANNAALCITAPTITSAVTECTPPSQSLGQVTLTATIAAGGTRLEYSKDGVTYQPSRVLTGLAAGTQTVYARRQSGSACATTPVTQTVTIGAAPEGFTATTIADANLADALRSLYPALIGPVGDNRLTQAGTCFTTELNLSGWGNATNSRGDSSAYAVKPKLTTIAGLGGITGATSVDLSNQALTTLADLPAGAKRVKAINNRLTGVSAPLPTSLEWLELTNNTLTTLPALPSGLVYLNVNNNRLTTLAGLPDGLKYLYSTQQHTKAPLGASFVSDETKTLTSLPALPTGLIALDVSNNKLNSFPALPTTLIFLRFRDNLSLTCFPTLPTGFFDAVLTPHAAYGVADPRILAVNTGIRCLPPLTGTVTTAKFSPGAWISANFACATAPTMGTALIGCSPAGSSTGEVQLNASYTLSANFNSRTSLNLEYSKDGTTYQDKPFFSGLAPGDYTFYARRKAGEGGCQGTAVGTTAVTVPPCNPTTYYVSTSGNDTTGTGTQASPWKTILFALGKVKANQGDTLRLAAGTYTESDILNIPSGVSLIGAGKDQTVIRVNVFYRMTDFPLSCSSPGRESYAFRYDRYVIQLNGSNQVLRGFTLDGQAKKSHGGIYATQASRVIFDQLFIRDFFFGGAMINKSVNTEFRYSTILNSAWGNGRGDAGSIMFYECDNLLIHHNQIQVDEVGGYGIKTAVNLFANSCQPNNEQFSAQADYVAKTLVNVKIYNNTVTVPELGAWNNRSAPAFCIELPNTTPRECEIYNNTFNNGISLPGINTASDGYQYSGKTARIHHNIFDMGPESGLDYRYAVEASVHKLEIDHNYFKGGLYPIATFNDGLANDPRFRDHFIHHNVFYGQRGVLSPDNVPLNIRGPQGLLNYRVVPFNFRFTNNTVVDNNGVSTLINIRAQVPRVGTEIVNNIFYSPTQNFGKLLADTLFVESTFKRNLFFNRETFGSDNILADPKLQLTGDKPQPYFELAPGSPAVDAGVEIPGVTDGYQGAKPDLGAYESSQTVNLSVAQQDGDGGKTGNNQLKPNLQLINAGNMGVPYQDLKARYWLTVEDFASVNTFIDHAPVGNSNVKLTYVPLEQPRQGALGYLEYSFGPAAGRLNGAGNSGIIQSRVAKADWTLFNETDDYSFGANATITQNKKITLYRNGVLVWGTEPASVSANQEITVQTENRNNSPSTNTISTYLKVSNTGNVPVSYKNLTVRYWFSAEGTQPLNHWIDYALLGNKVKGKFTKPAKALTGADTYFELAVDSTAGTLYPLSNSGNIQYRLAKTDWSAFNETNDHSYKPAAPLADNDHVTVYYKGQLVYGTEPASGARVAAELPKSEFGKVVLYPNPSTGGRLFVKGGGATISRVELTTVTGQPVPTEMATGTGDDVQITPASTLSPGIYLLTIHTATGSVTKRLVVSETGFRSNR